MLHVAIVAAESLPRLRVSPDPKTGDCPVAPNRLGIRRWKPTTGNRTRSRSMSLAQAPPTTGQNVAPSATATKVAAVINVPHDPSDQELLTWWQDSGNRMAGVMSGMWAIVVAVTIPVVMNHL